MSWAPVLRTLRAGTRWHRRPRQRQCRRVSETPGQRVARRTSRETDARRYPRRRSPGGWMSGGCRAGSPRGGDTAPRAPFARCAPCDRLAGSWPRSGSGGPRRARIPPPRRRRWPPQARRWPAAADRGRSRPNSIRFCAEDTSVLPAEAHCTYRAPLNVETRRRLTLALAITAVVMVVEFIRRLLSGSLALLSDAAHLVGDVAAPWAAPIAA